MNDMRIHRSIRICQGKVAWVDQDDYPFLSRMHWRTDGAGYARTRFSKSSPSGSMHRMVALPDPDLQVDHINRNPLDNRRSNLRVCTASQNAMNSPVRTTNTSGFKGVSWHVKCKRWAANIRCDRRMIALGHYRDPIDAALAYDLAAIKYSGEFAWTNFLWPPTTVDRRDRESA